MWLSLVFALLPSWQQLREQLPSSCVQEPLCVDTKLQPDARPDKNRLTLFRERNGWCPYSERVWLALEYKGLYEQCDVFLIDNMGSRPNWFAGSTPQMQWPGESRLQGESMDIIKSLDERYPSPPLYNAHTQTAVAAFRDTFPRNARPSSRSAFLFSNQGDPLPRADFERTLDSVESLLVQGQREGQGEGQRGPFFCGAFSAADCAFAPFLERYAAQLPLLHSGLRVREGGGPRRPRLQAWFAAMDRPPLSFYPARVKGCDESWGRVLGQAGFGNGGIVPQSLSSASTSTSEAATTAGATPTSAPSADAVWRHYAAARAFVAPTARTEVAARIARNAEALVGDMQRTGAGGAGVGADEALRALALRLTRTEGGGGGGVEGVGTGAGTDAGTDTDTLTALAAAEYLHARVCVPRDMGVLPVEALRGELASLRAEAEAGARGVGV